MKPLAMASDRGRGFGSWRRPPLREIFYAEDRPIPAPGTRRFQPLSARSRIPYSLRAALFAAFAGRGFPSNFLRALVASVFGGGHRHDAQSTRVTGQACRKRPTHAGYRACFPPRAIIYRAPGCAATWRGVRKFPAAMRSIYPSPAHRLTLHFTRPSYSPHAGRADCACQSPRVCHWGLASVPPRHRSPRI